MYLILYVMFIRDFLRRLQLWRFFVHSSHY